jgi:hypothetical protein|tara:strand:- start:170 stop:604 length:435 start_codon:yes stop_codon:yes gene_type:complete
MTEFTDYFEMDDQKLIESRRSLERKIETDKEQLKVINDVFEHKFGNIARNRLRELGKDFGSTSIMVTNNIKLNATFRKKVEWDQVGLMTTLDTMDQEDARHYGKISVTVEERKYATATPAIKAKLEPHRTVDLAGVTFKIEDVE